MILRAFGLDPGETVSLFTGECQNLVLRYDFALVGYRNMVPSHLLEQLTKFLWDTNTGPGES